MITLDNNHMFMMGSATELPQLGLDWIGLSNIPKATGPKLLTLVTSVKCTRIWPEDCPKFRFLWRNLEVDRDPDVYEFERVVFGDASASFRVSQENAKIHEETFTLASKTVKKVGVQGLFVGFNYEQ